MTGAPYAGGLPEGCCIRIMTGAVMPDGADTVVMQECVQADNERITFSECPKFADNVRLAAEDLKQGQVVLKKGEKLTARDIPLLASLGLASIKVFRKLKVAVISTGNELKNLDEELAEGDIYDSNRYSIMALLSRLNVDVLDFGIIKDDK